MLESYSSQGFTAPFRVIGRLASVSKAVCRWKPAEQKRANVAVAVKLSADPARQAATVRQAAIRLRASRVELGPRGRRRWTRRRAPGERVRQCVNRERPICISRSSRVASNGRFLLPCKPSL